jgi:hypothetical protein
MGEPVSSVAFPAKQGKYREFPRFERSGAVERPASHWDGVAFSENSLHTKQGISAAQQGIIIGEQPNRHSEQGSF